MSGANSFGSRFVITSFGESHGPALGVVIDGVPAGVAWDQQTLLTELARRRPGQSPITTARDEADAPEVLSGVYDGKTLGTPIAVLIRNIDQRSSDYAEIAKSSRPGHADDVWRLKFGHVDPRGGGRSSGRETVSRVIAGSVAKMLLRHLAPQVRITGFAKSVGPISLSEEERAEFLSQKAEGVTADAYVARLPSSRQQSQVEELLLKAKAEGRSYGGVAEIHILGVPSGLGQPVFHKLKADLAAAIMSVGSVVAFEVGEGVGVARQEGSEFHRREGGEHYGGIRGGIATGEPIVLRATFKPTATVLDQAKKGRHDPCIVPRAIPVLEAMVSLVLADHALWMRTDRV